MARRARPGRGGGPGPFGAAAPDLPEACREAAPPGPRQLPAARPGGAAPRDYPSGLRSSADRVKKTRLNHAGRVTRLVVCRSLNWPAPRLAFPGWPAGTGRLSPEAAPPGRLTGPGPAQGRPVGSVAVSLPLLLGRSTPLISGIKPVSLGGAMSLGPDRRIACSARDPASPRPPALPARLRQMRRLTSPGGLARILSRESYKV